MIGALIYDVTKKISSILYLRGYALKYGKFVLEFQSTVEKVVGPSVFFLKIGTLKPVLRWGGPPSPNISIHFLAEAHDQRGSMYTQNLSFVII